MGESPWILDVDGHVMETKEVWESLPERFRDYAPRAVEYPSGIRMVVGDRLSMMYPTGWLERDGGELAGGHDPAARLPDMDVDGIQAAVVFPTMGLVMYAVTEREPQAALCRAINDWIANYCTHDQKRLFGVGMLPGNPDDALAEARHCVEDLGFPAVWRRPEGLPALPPLHAPEYEALWTFLSGARVPFFVHPGYNLMVHQEYFADRFDDFYLAGHAAHFPVEQMMALTSFITYGVLERHPSLRVGFVETGGLWALYYLHRLDEHLETFSSPYPLEHDASYYFERQCIVSVEDAEPGLAVLLDRFPDNVAFSSDYPHTDGTFPGSTRSLLESDQLNDVQRRAVLNDNARQFLGL